MLITDLKKRIDYLNDHNLPIQCLMCPPGAVPIKEVAALVRHVNRKHRFKVEEDKNYLKYKCEYDECQKYYFSGETYRKHKKHDHKEKEEDQNVDEENHDADEENQDVDNGTVTQATSTASTDSSMH